MSEKAREIPGPFLFVSVDFQLPSLRHGQGIFVDSGA